MCLSVWIYKILLWYSLNKKIPRMLIALLLRMEKYVHIHVCIRLYTLPQTQTWKTLSGTYADKYGSSCVRQNICRDYANDCWLFGIIQYIILVHSLFYLALSSGKSVSISPPGVILSSHRKPFISTPLVTSERRHVHPDVSWINEVAGQRFI